MKPEPNMPDVRRRGRSFPVGLGALISAATGVLVAYGAVPRVSRVMVVNSDSTVAKYAEVAGAFNASLGMSPTEVDSSKISDAQLRRLVSSTKPDVIYCIGAAAYQSATLATRDTPIIFSSAINWQRFPSRRRTHVIANELPATAQLTLFRHFFPGLKRVGVLYNRDINRQWFAAAQDAGREVGLEVVGYHVSRASRVDEGIRDLAPKVDAFWLAPDPVVLDSTANIELYFRLTQAARKPVIAYSAAFLSLNPVLVISPDMPTIGRQAAGLVRDLDTAEPVCTPAGSEVILNLRRVQEYGLEFNPESLDSVNRIIR